MAANAGREGHAGSRQFCTDEAGYDRQDPPLEKPPYLTQDEFFEHKRSSLSQCQVANVVFCDKDRNPKIAFKPSDDIYVLLTFKNVTTVDVVILCASRKFHRMEICMKLADTPHRYVPTAPRNTPIIQLAPGEEYTFFHNFSSAPVHTSKESVFTLIQTPQKAGEYTAKIVNYPSFEFEGSHSFKIEED